MREGEDLLVILKFWRARIQTVAISAILAAVFSSSAMLARDTTSHDWYAASKLTFVEWQIAVGLDESSPVRYRNAEGVVETISRLDFKRSIEPQVSKLLILYAVRNSAPVGGFWGFVGALMTLLLTNWPRYDWRIASPAPSPPPLPRPGFLSEYEPSRATHTPPASARIGEPAPAPRIAADTGSAKKPRQAKRKRRRKPGRWV